jgi:muramoyltetrapeptide carboxypeptidase
MMPGEAMKTIKPKGLRKGDCIGILSPASPPDKKKLKQGIKYIESSGFRIKMFAPKRRTGYFSGTDDERAEQINKAFIDEEVDAIICSRGGYGSMRILEKVDYTNILSHPKLLVGFSDITALHFAVFKKCGLSSLHGPMISYGFNEKREKHTIDSFWNSVLDDKKVQLNYPADKYKWKVIKQGSTKGVLLGGNLTLISMLIGTDYLPDLRDNVLFIEDLDEKPYKIDRLLMHLKLSGKLDKLRGVVIGEMLNCANPPGGESSFTLRQVYEDFFREFDFPVIYNFPAGHGKRNLSLPLGIKMEIDTRKGQFYFTERVVR